MSINRPIPSGVPPTWALYRSILETSARGPAYKLAAGWALDALEETLGDVWLRRALEADRPPPLLSHLTLVAGHVQALAEVLEWALRLQLVRALGGQAKLRRDLIGNPNEGRTLHTALQLCVAANAIRLGWVVELEPAGTDAAPPADLRVGAPTGEMLVEVRVRSEADMVREFRRKVDVTHDRLFLAGARHDAWVEGRLGRLPTQQELDDIEHQVAEWARTRRGRSLWRAESIDLRIVPRADATGRLTSPPMGGDTLHRLAGALTQKAARMQQSGAQWLRILPLTGMFSQTEWATRPLQQKLEDLVLALNGTFGDERPAGVVVSSAASLYPGDVPEEYVTSGDAMAVRCAVGPLRARETLVVPLRDDAATAAADWLALAEAERDWLDWALARQALPPLADICG